MIEKLPKWALVNKFPAFFDTESLTSTEQVARVYGKINELIESYNTFAEEINSIIGEYNLEEDANIQNFICRISTLAHNYINTIDMKIMHQDRKIAEVYEQFSEDMIQTFKLFISELKTSGNLDSAILEAVDNLNEKMNSFIVDYQETKSALETDYQETKSALLEQFDYKNQMLYGTSIESGVLNEPILIQGLEKYSLLQVYVGSSPCFCTVENHSDEFTIIGTGVNNSVAINDGSQSYLSVAFMIGTIENGEYRITENKSYTIMIAPNEEEKLFIGPQPAGLIKGIV